MTSKRGGQPLVYDILCQDINVPLNLTKDEKQDWLLYTLAGTLTYLCNQGDKIPTKNKQFRSSSGRLPPITLEAYIARLLQYAPCDRECFLTALMYMDRLAEKCGFVFNTMNIHRSLLTSLLVAAKFFEDQPCDNQYFATVGGVTVQELNAMELTFLSMMEYQVAVTGFEFNLYSQLFEDRVQTLAVGQHKKATFSADIMFTGVMDNGLRGSDGLGLRVSQTIAATS